MKGKVKKILDKTLFALGLAFTFGVFSSEFRLQIANAVAVVLDPLLTLPIHIVIFILAAITAAYSSVIQKYTVDTEKMKEIQQIVMAFHKEYAEAVKQNNKYKLKKLEEKKPEIQKLQGEMMGSQMRTMSYTVAVTLPIFYWLWARIYDVHTAVSKFYGLKSKFIVNVPFGGEIHVSDPVLFIPWWIFWYFLCSILLSQVIRKSFKLG